MSHFFQSYHFCQSTLPLCIQHFQITIVYVTFLLRVNKSFFYNKCTHDPLGQPTVKAGSECRLIFKFWDGRTDTLGEKSDHFRPGLWTGSWINKYYFYIIIALPERTDEQTPYEKIMTIYSAMASGSNEC